MASIVSNPAPSMSFSEQIDLVDSLFSSWNECEKVVALYYLLRKLPVVQTKFLAQVLDQFVSGFSPSDDQDEQANNPVFLNSLFSEASTDLGQIVAVLLHCLPLLRPGNQSAKSVYLRLISTAIQLATETGRYRSECQQVLSYALIHPAISADELATFNSGGNLPLKTGASTVTASVSRQNVSTEDTSCISNTLENQALHTPAPGPADGVGAFFGNGDLSHLLHVQSGESMHQHSASSRQLSTTVGGASKMWNFRSAVEAELSTTDPSLQFAAPSIAVRQSQTIPVTLGPSSDFGSAPPAGLGGGSPSSFMAVGSQAQTPTTMTHASLRLSKSVGVTSAQSRQGMHQKLSRAAPIVLCSNSEASVNDWLRHNVDAIGTGRWDSGRLLVDVASTSSCHMSSSLECNVNHGVELLSSSSSSLHMPLSPQSSDASSGSGGCGQGNVAGDPYGLQGSIGGEFLDDGSSPAGMQDILVWLKILRLHKYSSLFLQMTYDEMMNLTDDWLDSQGVTKGARNKILISVKKLHERPANLRQIEKDVMSSGNVRGAIDQLRQVVNTPIKAYDIALSETQVSLSAPSDSVEDVNNSCTDDGRRSSESENLSDLDLPGLITRVLGKLCTQLLVTMRPDTDCLTNYLHLLDRCINHQAYTAEQRRKLLSWRQQIQRVLQFAQRQHRTAVSSTSLPPPPSSLHPRHRPLRGQPSVGSSTAQPQPAWTFIGSTDPMARSRQTGHRVASWQASAPPGGLVPQPHMISAPLRAAAQIDSSASYVKLPLGRTQSAPLRSAKPGVSVVSAPVLENDLSSASEDLHASLNSLCISMMEAAMGSGLGDGNWSLRSEER